MSCGDVTDCLYLDVAFEGDVKRRLPGQQKDKLGDRARERTAGGRLSGGVALSRRPVQASMRLKYAVTWLGARVVKGHVPCAARSSVLGLSSKDGQASDSSRMAADAVLVE